MPHSTLKLGQFGIAVCLTLVVARPAWSQRPTPPRAPTGGLFGATRSDVAGADKLNFMFEVAEGLDSDLPQDFGARLPRNVSSGGLSTVFEAVSDYSHSGTTLRLAGSASTALKYYQSLQRLDVLSNAAGLGANVKLPKSGNLRLDQAAAYSPSYLYQLFPVASSPTLGESIPANPDYQIAGTESYSYTSTLALSFGSTLGTQVTTSGQFSRTDFQNEAATFADLDTYEAGIEIAHHPSRRGGFSLAYDRRSADFGTGGVTNEHRLTVGVEYSPALSRTRRALFRVELAPAQLDLPQEALIAVAPDQVDTNLFRMSGEASASYPFKLNWLSTARYRRSVEYLSVLGQPVLSDAARLELRGLLARRVDLSASAGYATAASAIYPAQTVETYTGEVSVRYAVKRSIAVYSEYLYYYYDQRGLSLVPGLPSIFEQHGVRLGVALFIDTLGR